MNRVEKTPLISEHNKVMLLNTVTDWIRSDTGYFGLPYPYLLVFGKDRGSISLLHVMFTYKFYFYNLCHGNNEKSLILKLKGDLRSHLN
jgi:hypothetical protein